jgi:hypothetical protein
MGFLFKSEKPLMVHRSNKFILCSTTGHALWAWSTMLRYGIKALFFFRGLCPLKKTTAFWPWFFTSGDCLTWQ